MTSNMFNKLFILNKTLVLPQFATALLSFVQITLIKKNKCLIFVKLERNGQMKCIFDKFCKKLKAPSFYGEWRQNLETCS